MPSKLGSLSNRALLVNNRLDLALYAGNRVVSAVSMKPPHDGRSRVRPAKVLCAVQISRTSSSAAGGASCASLDGASTHRTYDRTLGCEVLYFGNGKALSSPALGPHGNGCTGI
jgi:hypothetical protein